MSRLTLEEKAALLNHRGTTVRRFDIRADQWNQCLNGVQWDRPTTLFPICLALAATWDTNLVHDVATALSDEARAIYNGWHGDPNAPGEHKGLIYRAPVINIGRNPYWGRNHESWGEDPHLCGRMAVAYVRGLQGDDPTHLKIAATLKHFAVNNVEAGRQSLDALVPERTLREYWLPHFRDAVVEGRAQSLMASYNAINGTPNNINHWLLTEVLKNEWHHEGFVVSDLGGVRTLVGGHEKGTMSYEDAVAQSVMAGCDFSDKEYEVNIPRAVRSGKITKERLDDALFRVLRVRFRLGEFDPFDAGPYSRIPTSVIGSDAHRALALRAARESIVLLKNENGLLPLDKSKLRRIAIVGPLADRVVLNNYNGRTGPTVTALQGLRNRVAPGTEVTYARGCSVAGTGTAAATKVDREEGFSSGQSVKLEATEPGAFIQFAINVPASGRYEIKLGYKSFPTRGIYRLTVDGVGQGRAIDMFAAKGAYGQVADLGAITFDKPGLRQFRFTATGRNPSSGGFDGHFDRLTLAATGEVSVELEAATFTTGAAAAQAGIAEAAALAHDADVAVVCVGTDASLEQEGRDRESLGLPAGQQRLVEAVLAANPRTIVAEMCAGPLAVPWMKEHVPALLQTWWNGEEGGHAFADVLFGDATPAGRLPHTVYAHEAQVPPQDEYDITKGFTYMYLNGDPLFPFGHGLSYSQFQYGEMELSTKELAGDRSVTVTIDVENAGMRAGDEVVQLYVRACKSRVKRPDKELRGFQRVHLAPGEKKTVAFSLREAAFSCWNTRTHDFFTERGVYEILVGASSSDIRARASIEAK